MIARLPRNLLALLIAFAVTYFLAVATASQTALNLIAELGAPVDAAVRWQAIWHDLGSMLNPTAPIFLVGLVLAFPIATLIYRNWLPNHRLFGYVLAGFLVVITIHLLIQQFLGASGIAIARTHTGLIVHSMSGAVGGYVFALLASPHPQR